MSDCTCSNFPSSLGNVTFGASVGIGVTAPSEMLTVGEYTGSHPSISIGTNADNVRYGLSAVNGYLYLYGDFGYRFTAGAPGALTEYMTILAGGNVGIGATTPSQKLTVGEYADSHPSICIGSDVNNVRYGLSAFGGYLYLYGDGGYRFTAGAPGALMEYMTILVGGNVGIGNSSPAYPLDVNGDAHCTAVICGSTTVADSGGCYYAS